MTTNKDDDLGPDVSNGEKSEGSEQEPTTNETEKSNTRVTYSDQQTNITLSSSFHKPIFKEKPYYKQTYNSLIDQTQSSGRWAPVFGPPTIKSEEDYIRRMIEKDKKNNRG